METLIKNLLYYLPRATIKNVGLDFFIAGSFWLDQIPYIRSIENKAEIKQIISYIILNVLEYSYSYLSSHPAPFHISGLVHVHIFLSPQVPYIHFEQPNIKYFLNKCK